MPRKLKRVPEILRAVIFKWFVCHTAYSYSVQFLKSNDIGLFPGCSGHFGQGCIYVGNIWNNLIWSFIPEVIKVCRYLNFCSIIDKLINDLGYWDNNWDNLDIVITNVTSIYFTGYTPCKLWQLFLSEELCLMG